MKQTIAFLLLLTMLLSLCACGNKPDVQINSDITTSETTVPTLTENELKEATQYIKKSEEAILQAASYQVSNWTTIAEVMYYYFDDNEYTTDKWYYHRNTIRTITQLRVQAREDMAKAKEILLKKGSGDYYTSVKEYYTTVNTFLNLISEFPTGYSKVTFSQAISQHQSNCSAAYSNVEFYQ